jgi:hypothetical protein
MWSLLTCVCLHHYEAPDVPRVGAHLLPVLMSTVHDVCSAGSMTVMAIPPMGAKLRFHRTLHLYSATLPPASQLSIVHQGMLPS